MVTNYASQNVSTSCMIASIAEGKTTFVGGIRSHDAVVNGIWRWSVAIGDAFATQCSLGTGSQNGCKISIMHYIHVGGSKRTTWRGFSKHFHVILYS